MQLEFSLVPWAGGVVKHLATPAFYDSNLKVLDKNFCLPEPHYVNGSGELTMIW